MNPSRALLPFVLALLIAAPAWPAPPPGADRLQAAMIYNLAKFVRWPRSHRNRELRLCLVNASPVAEQLRSVSGRPVAGRRLNVDAAAARLSRCDVQVYGVDAVPLAAAERGILTIGTNPDFLNAGGMIALAVVDKKLVFDVHLTRLREAGLDLSAEALALARSVHR
ncbi:MAG: YfiR family protein [Pseudomonadota bacterium]